MTKDEVLNILILIESVYPQFRFKDDTVRIWYSQCREMDFARVIANLQTHISQSPYPPAISDIAAFITDHEDFSEKLAIWKQEGRERIEHDLRDGRTKPVPPWHHRSCAQRTI